MKVQLWVSKRVKLALILHPSTLYHNGWRITYWDELGPSGHTEHSSFDDAVADLRSQIGPWQGCPELDLPGTECTCEKVAVPPDWM